MMATKSGEPKNGELARGVSIAKVRGAELRQTTTVRIAYALMEVLQSHVGRQAAITQQDLFKQLYGHKYNEDNLADYLRWDFTKKAMHMLRQRSNCFVVANREDSNGVKVWKYFVIQDETDAELYRQMLEGCVKRMRSMQRRAFVSAQQQWYRQQWQLPGVRKPSQLSDAHGVKK
jgi:hypothetical protein